MASIGGDILEVAAQHPTLGTIRFYPKAGESSTVNTGGVRNNDDENGVDGSGELVVSKVRVRGMIEMVVANDMVGREDLQNAVKLAESPVNAVYTITTISGAVFQGSGIICGELPADIAAATFALKIATSKLNQI